MTVRMIAGGNLGLGRFLCFAFVGGVGTAIQYSLLGAGVALFAAPAALCSAIGYLLGSVANYLLNYRFTFGCRGSHTTVAAKYYTVLAIGWAINTLLMTWWAHRLHWNYWGAQALTTMIGLIWNFSGSALWAFKRPSALARIRLD